MTQNRDLALIDRARSALAEAKSIDEVKEHLDQAVAMKHYWARKVGAEEAERFANEIRLRAERRIGELTAAMPKAKHGGKGGGSESPAAGLSTKAATIKAAGIPKQDASRFENLARIPQATFEAEVVKPEANTRKLASLGRTFAPKNGRTTKPKPRYWNGESESSVVREQVLRLLDGWPATHDLAPLIRVLEWCLGLVKKEMKERHG